MSDPVKNHIMVVRDQLAFDYHDYSDVETLLAHARRRANQRWPGWDAELIELPDEVLISESKSRMHEGLWLKEPEQFLFDAMPRAQRYLKRFPVPPERTTLKDTERPSWRSASAPAAYRPSVGRTVIQALW